MGHIPRSQLASRACFAVRSACVDPYPPRPKPRQMKITLRACGPQAPLPPTSLSTALTIGARIPSSLMRIGGRITSDCPTSKQSSPARSAVIAAQTLGRTSCHRQPCALEKTADAMAERWGYSLRSMPAGRGSGIPVGGTGRVRYLRLTRSETFNSCAFWVSAQMVLPRWLAMVAVGCFCAKALSVWMSLRVQGAPTCPICVPPKRKETSSRWESSISVAERPQRGYAYAARPPSRCGFLGWADQ